MQKNWLLSMKALDYIKSVGRTQFTCHRELLIFAQDVIDCAIMDYNYKANAKSLFACVKRLEAPKVVLGKGEKIALWFISEVRKNLESRNIDMLTSEG